jgi:hypothetical protein
MLATLCNILTSCDMDIPKGTLPPIIWHSPASFVGAFPHTDDSSQLDTQ